MLHKITRWLFAISILFWAAIAMLSTTFFVFLKGIFFAFLSLIFLLVWDCMDEEEPNETDDE